MALGGAIAACKRAAKKKVQVSGRNHYVAFCKRLGFKDLAPPLDVIRSHTEARAEVDG